jgi:hypothetical protein
MTRLCRTFSISSYPTLTNLLRPGDEEELET